MEMMQIQVQDIQTEPEPEVSIPTALAAPERLPWSQTMGFAELELLLTLRYVAVNYSASNYFLSNLKYLDWRNQNAGRQD